MNVSQSLDMVVSCLLFSLCLSVLPNVAALRTLVLLDVQSPRTSKFLEKKTNGTFDDARWILAIIRVAPECRDIARLAWLRRGTRLMRILTKTREGYKKGRTRDESSLAVFWSTCRVELCR
jgi:hypothetical protein